MDKTINFFATWFMTLLGCILVLAASLHILQLDTISVYIRSPYIAIEFSCIITMLLLFIFQPAILTARLVEKKWMDAILITLNLFFGFVLLGIAMVIDSPTLIFMT